MPKGKRTCKILKEIRKQIAAENDIELVISECTYQGDCLGTCPKCEAEVRYLERELEKRQRLGKAVAIAGLSVGMLGALPEAVAQQPDSTMMLDTIEEEIEEIGLMGCVRDIQPEFVGGDKAMLNYIAENMMYPLEAKKAKIEGKVIVSFYVDVDGSIADVTVERGIGFGCDEEAVRVIKSMPNWNPGMSRGRKVKVRMVLPVTFKLS